MAEKSSSSEENQRTVRVVISQAPAFSQIIKTPLHLTFSAPPTIIEVVLELDKQWLDFLKEKMEAVRELLKPVWPLFLDEKTMGLIHLLWHPMDDRFYSDVGYEIFTPEAESGNSRMKIEQPSADKIPFGSNVILMPDMGC